MDKYQRYEAEKQALARKGLSHDEYQRRLKELVKKHKI